MNRFFQIEFFYLALYALLNVGFIWLAVWLRRSTFLVFEALGAHVYLGHLAYEVFKDSFFASLRWHCLA